MLGILISALALGERVGASLVGGVLLIVTGIRLVAGGTGSHKSASLG
jgi:drug/metabolite transporter (DMT)-like permease